MTNTANALHDIDPADSGWRGPMYRYVGIYEQAELRAVRVDVRDLAAGKGENPWRPFAVAHTPLEAVMIIKAVAVADMGGTLPGDWSETTIGEFDAMGHRIGGLQ